VFERGNVSHLALKKILTVLCPILLDWRNLVHSRFGGREYLLTRLKGLFELAKRRVEARHGPV
jgi:hypothetical protein